MKLIKAITNAFPTFGDSAITLEQLLQVLDLPMKRAHIVVEALAELESIGKVAWIDDKRFVATNRRDIVTGKVQWKNEGFGFLIPDKPDGEDFYIPRHGIGIARPGDRVVAQVRRLAGGRAEAFVQQVLERSTRAIIGMFVGSGGGGYVIPENLPGVQKIHIVAGNTHDAKDNQKVEVEVPDGGQLSEHMKGRIINVLGYPGSLATERAALLRTYGFPLSFSAIPLEEAEACSAEPDADRDAGRVDLTAMVCATIDPHDAKDFDDALSLEPSNDGWTGAVHIADVSYYIRPGSALDSAAKQRATSVYLPQGAAPMLPDRLSGNLCSLRPLETRRAMSVLFDISVSGEIRSAKIVRSWIRSRRRFDYETVQAILDEYDRKRGKEDRWVSRIKAGTSEPWESRLVGLRWFSRLLRNERLEAGGIEFESPEVKIELDAEGRSIGVIPRKELESYRIVEEWMLLANRTVTELFQQHVKQRSPFVYRVHDTPEYSKVDEFITLGEDLGFPWTGGDPVNSKDFQRYVVSLRDSAEAPILMGFAIRSMMRAHYTTSNRGHFGLGFTNYTHFTSPIRRYPDLLVHRLLNDWLLEKRGKRNSLKANEALEELCRHCSEREQAATEAEREGIKWKQAEYLQQFVGLMLSAIVVAIKPRGIFVELTETLAQSFLPMDRLGPEYLVFHPRTHQLRSRSGQTTYRLGDRIQVIVDRVDMVKHRVELSLANYHTTPINGDEPRAATTSDSFERPRRERNVQREQLPQRTSRDAKPGKHKLSKQEAFHRAKAKSSHKSKKK